ncbi:hypothetical protein BJ878DRAFT_251881 [Calycina marina]|uniref:ER membrane protein complex subunit 7 beta-sandwich domain-containing protein n=1 Tax=Calycina marina TaxID=1763456 RepID=A0A9P7YXH4_9HELO|nr:hypothetical protein BJ878DRAFT_251881 [Calycina marina]
MHLKCFLLLPILSLVLSAHLRFTIPTTAALNPSILPPSTSATLTTLKTHYSAPLRSDNTFDFRNVTTGSYLLDVHCHTHSFAPLRVDVTVGSIEGVGGEMVEAWGTFRGNEWGNKGEAMGVEIEKNIWKFPVRAAGVKEYLVERAGFSPLSILKSPMILIAIVSMGLVFGMPYLMDNMDPEMKAEFEERQKSGGVGATAGVQNIQNFDAAAWLAGTGKDAKKGEAQGKITK